jgi:aspartate/tyrosine/aromatic aminotransferase
MKDKNQAKYIYYYYNIKYKKKKPLGSYQDAGLKVSIYKYYRASDRAIDFNGMMEDLSKIQSGSVVLLNPCAHSPTGVDPNESQWR